LPKSVDKFHTIIATEKWDQPETLKPLMKFLLKVEIKEYLSGECDSKCTQFQFPNYEAAKKVFEQLHRSWLVSPDSQDDEYAPTPFAKLESNSFGVTVTGDCEHVNAVRFDAKSGLINELDLDPGKLRSDDSLKSYRRGSCKASK
jgi:hypothetical protein